MWWGSFALFSFLGVLWAMAIAPVQAPDEASHAIRAAAVVRGEWQTEWTLRTGLWGARIPDTPVRVPKAYRDFASMRCPSGAAREPATCLPPVASEPGPDVEATTHVGAYQPTYYLAVGWPSLFLRPLRSLVGMRSVGAVICAALLASAVLSLRGGRRRALPLAGLALALTPATASLVGSVNPNGLEIAAAIGLWAAMLALLQDDGPPSSRLLVRTAVAAVLLAGVRPLSPAFLVLVVAVAAGSLVNVERLRALMADRRVRRTTAVVGVAVLASVAFVTVNDSLSAMIRWPGDQPSTAARARTALGLTGRNLQDAVGLLSGNGVDRLDASRIVSIGWLALTGALGALALVLGSARERLGLVTLALGGLAMPVIAGVTTPESPWQGRYALPLLVGLPLLGASVVDRSPRLRSVLGRAIVVVVAVFVGVSQFAAYLSMLARNAAGWGSPLADAWNPVVWNGSPDGRLLVVLAAVGTVVLTAALVRSASRPVGGAPAPVAADAALADTTVGSASVAPAMPRPVGPGSP